jgi:hypothetical protein
MVTPIFNLRNLGHLWIIVMYISWAKEEPKGFRSK